MAKQATAQDLAKAEAQLQQTIQAKQSAGLSTKAEESALAQTQAAMAKASEPEPQSVPFTYVPVTPEQVIVPPPAKEPATVPTTPVEEKPAEPAKPSVPFTYISVTPEQVIVPPKTEQLSIVEQPSAVAPGFVGPSVTIPEQKLTVTEKPSEPEPYWGVTAPEGPPVQYYETPEPEEETPVSTPSLVIPGEVAIPKVDVDFKVLEGEPAKRVRDLAPGNTYKPSTEKAEQIGVEQGTIFVGTSLGNVIVSPSETLKNILRADATPENRTLEQQIDDHNKRVAEVNAAMTVIEEYGKQIDQKWSDKINDKGMFTGTDEEYAEYVKELAILNARVKEANAASQKLNKDIEQIKNPSIVEYTNVARNDLTKYPNLTQKQISLYRLKGLPESEIAELNRIMPKSQEGTFTTKSGKGEISAESVWGKILDEPQGWEESQDWGGHTTETLLPAEYAKRQAEEFAAKLRRIEKPGIADMLYNATLETLTLGHADINKEDIKKQYDVEADKLGAIYDGNYEKIDDIYRDGNYATHDEYKRDRDLAIEMRNAPGTPIITKEEYVQDIIGTKNEYLVERIDAQPSLASVAMMYVPFEYARGNRWNELHLWEKIIYPALDVAIVVPVVGWAAKGSAGALKATTIGAKIAEAGGKVGLEQAVNIARVAEQSAKANILSKVKWANEIEKSIPRLLEEGRTAKEIEWVRKYLVAAKEDVAIAKQELQAAQTELKNLETMYEAALRVPEKDIATKLYKTTRGIEAVSAKVSKPTAEVAGGLILGTTIYNWDKLNNAERGLGLFMAGAAKHAITGGRLIDSTFNVRSKIPISALGGKSGSIVPKVVIAGTGVSYEAAREAMADLMRQASQGVKYPEVKIKGTDKILTVRSPGYQRVIGNTLAHSGPFGEKWMAKEGITELEKVLGVTAREIKGSEGGVYFTLNVVPELTRQAAHGTKGKVPSVILASFEEIETLPEKAYGTKNIDEMAREAIAMLQSGSYSDRMVEGLKRWKIWMEEEAIATTGSKLFRVKNLSSKLADKLNKKKAGNYYTTDKKGKIELVQMYLLAGDSTPYTLKQMMELRGVALENELYNLYASLTKKAKVGIPEIKERPYTVYYVSETRPMAQSVKNIIKQVQSDPLYKKLRAGIHGDSHAERVYVLANKLADMIEQRTGQKLNREAIAVGALLHDSKRINDVYDKYHAVEGAKAAIDLIERKKLPVDKDMVYDIIVRHDPQKGVKPKGETTFLEAQVVSDADKLDRYRFGQRPSIDYFELKDYSVPMMDFARSVSRERWQGSKWQKLLGNDFDYVIDKVKTKKQKATRITEKRPKEEIVNENLKRAEDDYKKGRLTKKQYEDLREEILSEDQYRYYVDLDFDKRVLAKDILETAMAYERGLPESDIRPSEVSQVSGIRDTETRSEIPRAEKTYLDTIRETSPRIDISRGEIPRDITPPYIPLRDITPPYISPRDITPPYIPLRDITPPYIPLRDITPPYIPPRDITPPYIPLRDISPPVPPPPVPPAGLPPSKAKGDKLRDVEWPPGTITWKHGKLRQGTELKDVWKVIPPPYNLDKPYTMFSPPRGAHKFAEGPGSAYETIQVIGGMPPKNVDVDLGWADVHIRSDEGKVKIKFEGGGLKTDVGERIPGPTQGITLAKEQAGTGRTIVDEGREGKLIYGRSLYDQEESTRETLKGRQERREQEQAEQEYEEEQEEVEREQGEQGAVPKSYPGSRLVPKPLRYGSLATPASRPKTLADAESESVAEKIEFGGDWPSRYNLKGKVTMRSRPRISTRRASDEDVDTSSLDRYYRGRKLPDSNMSSLL